MMPNSLKGESYRNSMLSLARNVLKGTDKRLEKYFEGDPKVNVIAHSLKRMINDCRKEELYPEVVADRERAPLIAARETEWTMVDFEDVVMQNKSRRRFPELERCRFRHKAGLYGVDRYHVKRKVRKQACRELLKAIRRTAISKYGESTDESILLVIYAGGNCEGNTYDRLDSCGKAYRKAEILASTELCALHGHPVSKFHSKIKQLCRWRRGNHMHLLRKSLKVVAKPLRAQKAKK